MTTTEVAAAPIAAVVRWHKVNDVVMLSVLADVVFGSEQPGQPAGVTPPADRVADPGHA